MQTNIYLCLDRQGKLEEVLLTEPIYIKIDSSHVECSTNGGDILVSLEDGVISAKALSDIEGLTFNDHSVIKGGIYFFEPKDLLVMGSVKAFIKVKEVVEKTVTIKNPLTQDDTQDDTSPGESFDFELKNIHEVQKDIKIPETNSQSMTRTSIDINELINEAKDTGGKKGKKSKKTEKPQENELLDESKRNYVSKEKLSRKNRAQLKKSSAFKDLQSNSPTNLDDIVGPLTRLFGVLTSLIICLSLYPYSKDSNFQRLLEKVNHYLNIPLQSFELPSIPTEVLSIALIYILVETLSTILFSTSLPLFLIGVTSSGNFLTKRIKALIRLPLSLVSILFPIGELPLLLGRKSLKETLSFSFIHYRFGLLKFLSIPLLIAISLIGYSHTAIKSIVTTGAPIKVESLKVIKQGSLRQYGHLVYNEKLNSDYKIVGSSHQRALYSIVERRSGHTMQISEIKEIKFDKLERLKETSPLLKYGFPFLNTFFMTQQPNKKVREDVKKIISTGLLLRSERALTIDPLLLPVAPAALDFIDQIGLNFEKMSVSNDHYFYLFESGPRRQIVFIDEASIKVFAIEVSDKKMLSLLDNFQFKQRSPLKGLTRLDAYLSLSSQDNDSSELVSFQQELQTLMKDEAPSQFNKHIQALINQINESLADIDTELTKKLEELMIQ